MVLEFDRGRQLKRIQRVSYPIGSTPLDYDRSGASMVRLDAKQNEGHSQRKGLHYSGSRYKIPFDNIRSGTTVDDGSHT